MSWARLCEDCGVQRKTDELNQLHQHHGPHFEHWRQRMAASVGAIIPERLDDAPERR